MTRGPYHHFDAGFDDPEVDPEGHVREAMQAEHPSVYEVEAARDAAVRAAQDLRTSLHEMSYAVGKTSAIGHALRTVDEAIATLNRVGAPGPGREPLGAAFAGKYDGVDGREVDRLACGPEPVEKPAPQVSENERIRRNVVSMLASIESEGLNTQWSKDMVRGLAAQARRAVTTDWPGDRK